MGLLTGLDSSESEKKLIPKLYHLDPSGSFIRYHAKAIGSGEETAMEQLLNNYKEVITEAIGLTLLTLKTVMEEKITEKNIDITILEKSSNEQSIPKIRKIQTCELYKFFEKENI